MYYIFTNTTTTTTLHTHEPSSNAISDFPLKTNPFFSFYRKYKIVKNLDAYKQSQVFLCPSQRQSALGTPEIETHNQTDAGAGKQ